MNAGSVPVLSPALSPGSNRRLTRLCWLGLGTPGGLSDYLDPRADGFGSLGALAVVGTPGTERPRSLSQDKCQGLWRPFC